MNGREGKFDVQDDTQILTFKNASGQWVVIQAPVSLGWDSAELAKRFTTYTQMFLGLSLAIAPVGGWLAAGGGAGGSRR